MKSVDLKKISNNNRFGTAFVVDSGPYLKNDWITPIIVDSKRQNLLRKKL